MSKHMTGVPAARLSRRTVFGGIARIALIGTVGLPSLDQAAARQATAGGDWVSWKSLLGDLGVTASDVGVDRNADGRLQIFVLGDDGEVYHKWQESPGSAEWVSWKSLLGDLQEGSSNVSVAANADGRLQIFVRGQNGVVYTKWQQ